MKFVLFEEVSFFFFFLFHNVMKTWVVVWTALRFREYTREWNCVWEGTDNGKLVVNTDCGQKEKSTCETSLKGSVTGKTFEAAFCGAGQSSTKAAMHLFNIKKNPAKETRQRFQMSKEPLMRNHYSFNWTNIPGIQSHLISKEKLLTQCWKLFFVFVFFFLHLVPLMEMTTSAPILFTGHI